MKSIYQKNKGDKNGVVKKQTILGGSTCPPSDCCSELFKCAAEIWASIDAILVVVISAYTVEQVAQIKTEGAVRVAQMYSETLNRAMVQLEKFNK